MNLDIYKERINRFVYKTRDNFDHLIISSPTNIRYLTSIALEPIERLFLLIISTRNEAIYIVAPELEKERVIYKCMELGIEPLIYRDSEDPYLSLANIIESNSILGVENNIPYGIIHKLGKYIELGELRLIDDYINGMRLIKDEYEIKILKEAAKINQEVIKHIIANIHAGITERELANEACVYASSLGVEKCIHPIIQSGPNTSLPHMGSSNRKISSDDVVLIDFTILYNGYVSDITRVVSIGDDTKYRKIFYVVRDAQEKAIDIIRPNIPAYLVDREARGFIEEHGYGEFFIHRTGHGIGLEVHEEPYIHSKSNIVLSPGMVFTVEPGIYIPGKFGVRIEDNILVTSDGYVNLVNLPKSLSRSDYLD